MLNRDLPKLLRAIAGGTQAQENRHDIILNAAADELERSGIYSGKRRNLTEIERIKVASNIAKLSGGRQSEKRNSDIPLCVISRCRASIEYGTEQCQADLMSDGSIRGRYCGDPCSFIMKKGGVGDPPFRWRRKLFAGDVEVPGRDWEEG